MNITPLTTLVIIALLLPSLTLAGGNAKSGETKSLVCAACHGSDGNSPTGNFPRLADLGEKYLIKQMRDIKSGDRKIVEMTGMLSQLTEKDFADIAAFYAKATRKISGAEENQKGLTLGENIYRGGNLETNVPACTGCHSPSGNGNAPAGYPALGGQHAVYIAGQLRAFRTGAHDAEDTSARMNDQLGVMRGVAARMTDQEIDAVANYVSGLH
jgi:cytochrome c553